MRHRTDLWSVDIRKKQNICWFVLYVYKWAFSFTIPTRGYLNCVNRWISGSFVLQSLPTLFTLISNWLLSSKNKEVCWYPQGFRCCHHSLISRWSALFSHRCLVSAQLAPKSCLGSFIKILGTRQYAPLQKKKKRTKKECGRAM